jgi:hypothetical protein
MSGNTEGAGPAIAAHSKDASTPGPTPASDASGAVKPASDSGEAISYALQQATDFVRGEPLASMGIFIIAGIVIGKVLSRR